jgi:fatty-acyl-CoA synthase
MNLADIGSHWARWQPNEVALRFGGESITWRELESRSDAIAFGLQGFGVRKGDRIAIMMLNCVEWIELTIAAWKVGALIVPLNVRFTATEVAYVVSDCAARLLVVDSSLPTAASQVGEATQVMNVDELARLRTITTEHFSVVATVESDAAFLCYTSGTTGDPKGAILTHGSWNVASQGWAQAIEFTPKDRVVLPFPLAFTGGLAVFLMTYWAGARLVLEPSPDPDRLFDLFETERISALLAVPVIHQQLVDHPRFGSADLSSWRIASSGGAPVPLPLIQAIQARGIPMLQGFSLTEASAAASILPAHDAVRKLGSAGLPVMHGSIGIVDEHNNECPPGTVGEIVVGGPQIMAGYWGNPDASAQALAGGVLHTGDLGYLDEEGYLFVVDRMKDMLISGGLNVYPAEIERALSGISGIAEVAVIGVPDARWGETPAVIAFTNGAALTAEVVLEACSATLADYKIPRYLLISKEPLPRNMSGKILKRDLKLRYANLAQTTTPIR